ncbi:MAG TPA: DNA ligase D [Vicinamibacterales bacterium]|nr:DNA ligase D [Vicinamibacterales bacterium]
MKWTGRADAVRPMLATLAAPPLTGKSLLYEPKYDGIRAIAQIEPGRGGTQVRLWSRLGNEKTSQFPSLAGALTDLGTRAARPLIVDGEIVALDDKGRPAGFQRLQGRIHLTSARDVERIDRSQPVAFIVFDLIRHGNDDLRSLPLVERRARLERLVEGSLTDTLRMSEQAAGDGRALLERARQEGWEGLIAKESRSVYESGRRSAAWRKLKVLNQQEFVVGGWTEPRQTRQRFGALLLGVYSDDAARGSGARALRYVGHTGTGFSQAELDRVWKRLAALETPRSPFSDTIKANEPAHWVRPELVAQVRFTEWTDEGKLRHPVYLGLRDDKPATAIVREVPLAKAYRKKDSVKPLLDTRHVVAQLAALEDARRDGSIELPDGARLGVTNLAKVFWPKPKLTKGDLLRYYAKAAPFILPAVADRPLVMKRFPDGVEGPAFYQQRKRLEQPPRGVRIETLPEGLDPISEPDARRFIGGALITLLYMTQIAAISQDPWFSRVQSPLDADYVAIDLDPVGDTPFATVLEVARLVRDELHSLKVPSVPKTSGSRGLHVYIPLPPGTSYESGMLFCQIVATVVASRHPKIATVERMVRARAKGTVYVDYLQNIRGKTLATAYSARASDFAGVSTPLTWKEVDEGVDPRDFTIVTAPGRFERVGDLWEPLRTSKPANLESVFRKYARKGS